MNKLLNYFQKGTIILVLLSLFLNFSVKEIYAEEKQNIQVTLNDNGKCTSTQQNTRIPNVIAVWAEKVSDNKVKVFVGNTGIDVFDKVTCTIKITDNNGALQYNQVITFEDIKPFIHQKEDIYIVNWSETKISSIRCTDGDDFGTLLPVVLQNPTFN